MKLRFSRWTFAIVLLAGAVVLLLWLLFWTPGEVRRQKLADGSLLIITRSEFGPTNRFTHGTQLERLLGNSIPSNGLQVARTKLERPVVTTFSMLGKPWLTVEFKSVPSSPDTTPPLANQSFFRQFRCVVGGGSGALDYVEEFLPLPFERYRDGMFGYILSSRFPRDAKWLSLRVQQQTKLRGPWQTVASFRLKNPTRPEHHVWKAEALPATKKLKDWQFTLEELSVEPRNARDPFWNRTISLFFRVQTNGVSLTNWSAAHIEAEDASGNWESLATLRVTNDLILQEGWRGLDPRFVWKLEVEFSPASQFAPENLFRFQVPVSLPAPIQTNWAGLPLQIDWVNQRMLSVQLLTNRADLRLLFVAASDPQGRNLDDTTGSWDRAGFWRALRLDGTNQSVQATIALVPNVPLTYYVQPKPMRADRQLQPGH